MSTKDQLIDEFYNGVAEKDWPMWANEAVSLLEGIKQPHNHFNSTCDWFVAAGQQPSDPEFNSQQVCFYLGMQLEELAEKLALLPHPSFDDMAHRLQSMATAFKMGRWVADVNRAVHVSPALWLDADMDLIWVTLGAARAMGVEPSAAYALVADANWAKFPNGQVTRDANGKVVKPAGWKEADLMPVLPAVLRREYYNDTLENAAARKLHGVD